MFIPFGKNHKNKSQKKFFSDSFNPVTNHFKFNLSVFGVHPTVSNQNSNTVTPNSAHCPIPKETTEDIEPKEETSDEDLEEQGFNFLKGILLGLVALSCIIALLIFLCKKRKKKTQLLEQIRR